MINNDIITFYVHSTESIKERKEEGKKKERSKEKRKERKKKYNINPL